MMYNTENFLFIDAAKYREETSGRIILAATIWLYLTNGRLGQFCTFLTIILVFSKIVFYYHYSINTLKHSVEKNPYVPRGVEYYHEVKMSFFCKYV